MALIEGQVVFIGGLGAGMIHYPHNFRNSRYKELAPNEGDAVFVPFAPLANAVTLENPDDHDMPPPITMEQVHEKMLGIFRFPMRGAPGQEKMTEMIKSNDLLDVIRVGFFCDGLEVQTNFEASIGHFAENILASVFFYHDVYRKKPEETKELLISKTKKKKHERAFERAKKKMGPQFTEAMEERPKQAKLPETTGKAQPTVSSHDEVKEGEYGFCLEIGAILVKSAPYIVDGKTLVPIRTLHPYEQNRIKLYGENIRKLPSKDRFRAALKIMLEPQEPVSSEDLLKKRKELLKSGEVEDIARIVSYLNGRKGKGDDNKNDIKDLRKHALWTLASVQMALTLKERGLDVPVHGSTDWHKYLEQAVNYVEKDLPKNEADEDLVITQTLEEIEEVRLESERAKAEAGFQEEIDAAIADVIEVFTVALCEYAGLYGEIYKTRKRRGKKAQKEQADRMAQGLPARPSFSALKLSEKHRLAICDPILDVAEDMAMKKHCDEMSGFLPEPIEGKEWQAEILRSQIIFKDRADKEEEIVKLFERDELSFREAKLVLSGAFNNSVADDLVVAIQAAELSAYLYEDAGNILSEEEARKARFSAVAKAIDGLEGSKSVSAQRSQRDLKHWLNRRKSNEAEAAPSASF